MTEYYKKSSYFFPVKLAFHERTDSEKLVGRNTLTLNLRDSIPSKKGERWKKDFHLWSMYSKVSVTPCYMDADLSVADNIFRTKAKKKRIYQTLTIDSNVIEETCGF